MPGTLIPVVEESRMFEDQPECAIILSWHIADELASKLRAKGYKGMLVTPLPVPRVQQVQQEQRAWQVAQELQAWQVAREPPAARGTTGSAGTAGK